MYNTSRSCPKVASSVTVDPEITWARKEQITPSVFACSLIQQLLKLWMLGSLSADMRGLSEEKRSCLCRIRASHRKLMQARTVRACMLACQSKPCAFLVSHQKLSVTYDSTVLKGFFKQRYSSKCAPVTECLLKIIGNLHIQTCMQLAHTNTHAAYRCSRGCCKIHTCPHVSTGGCG